jgi:hypothetical protein
MVADAVIRRKPVSNWQHRGGLEMISPKTYQYRQFIPSRLSTMDVCHIGRKKNYISAFLELDVTEARKRIREKKARLENVSVTAWLIKCISQVAQEYKEIHGIRKGRKIVVFDDVDIALAVEKEFENERVPLPYVIRKSNEKSVSEIHEEIRLFKDATIKNEGDFVPENKKTATLMKIYYALPGFVRRLYLHHMLRDPFRTKKQMGTIVVTSLGMMGRLKGWFTPIGIHPLIVAIGSIIKKPGVTGDTIAVREYIHITFMLDHDVIDGAPAARALTRLAKLIEKGENL